MAVYLKFTYLLPLFLNIIYSSSSILSNLKITGRVPSLQHVIIILSLFVHPRIMEPPCNAAYT